MWLEQRLLVLLQLHLHSRLNNWLQWIEQRQLQYETRIIKVLRFGASYTRDFTAWTSLLLGIVILQETVDEGQDRYTYQEEIGKYR